MLKTGNASIVEEDIEIAKVEEPGAVFGEISALLDQPHDSASRSTQVSIRSV
jgi:hypothetical protein